MHCGLARVPSAVMVYRPQSKSARRAGRAARSLDLPGPEPFPPAGNLQNRLAFDRSKNRMAEIICQEACTGASARYAGRQSPNGAREMVSDDKVQWVDRKSILFSLPTISGDLPRLEPVERELRESDCAFHEDDWSQVEFVANGQLAMVQRVLKEYKPFEAANRTEYGWRRIYARKIDRASVICGGDAVPRLEVIVRSKVGPAPVLLSADPIPGRVKDGFSLRLGGEVTLYGYATPAGIPVLGALIGDNPVHHKLTEAFLNLNAAEGLVLVDWRQQMILGSVGPDGNIRVWRP
jgi:hypothetical protein